VRSILVTSATEGEGKTTIALGLARSFAESLDERALLIEADLRRPALARHLGVRQRRGLADHLVDGVPLDGLVASSALPGLELLCAGEREVAGAANVISSERTRELLASAREHDPRRVLVIDAPPVRGALEPLSLALVVDGIILVVRAGHAPRDVVAQVVRELPREKLLGIVLNGVSPHDEDVARYGLYYGGGGGELPLYESAGADR
jgi:Mrp family chromosome partitioning ATPase